MVQENGNFTHHGQKYYFRTEEDQFQFEVSADGYRPIDNKESPVLFTNLNGSGFVIPAAPVKNLQGILTKLLNISEQQALLLIGCCIKSIVPGPNPVLLLIGPQGSGKTLAANTYRKIVDPDNTNGKVVLFDNVSSINGKMSDDICRLSHNTTVIVTTLNDQMPNQDLVDRTIVFEFEQISETERKPETQLLKAFETELHEIVGWLYSGLSAALANDDIKLPAYPSRLADLMQTVAAAAPGLGINHKHFNKALEDNRNISIESSLNQNPVSAAALAFMDHYEGDQWSGTPTKLLETLNDKVDDDITSHSNWPSQPNKLSAMLNRAAPFLKNKGLDIKWSKSGQRSITLVKLAQVIEEQSPTSSSMKDFVDSLLREQSNNGVNPTGPGCDLTAPSDSAHQETSAC